MPKLENEHWYEHAPKLVETSLENKIIILQNQQVQTDRTIPNDKLDMEIYDNERGTRMLIRVTILGDCSMIKKKAEKILKMKISAEIWRIWNVKAKVMPVITWATGTIAKSFRQ